MPVSMHPQIDALHCIGCGSCVRVCPEGDVLGLIEGKVTLIHAAKCVGHALCADECPVGAITMALALPGRNADLPILKESLETSVSGLYIAGELGGIGLIKNALNQGVRAMEDLASRLAHQQENNLDVVIVGAGPAGLAAALTAKKHNLHYKVLEQNDIGGTILQYPRRKIVMTSPVELPLYGKLKITETSKESLLQTWNRIIEKTNLEINTNEKVVEIVKSPTGFDIQTSVGSYSATGVVLALGRRGTPRKLGVPGEELSKVMYRLIEAESYQNSDLLVVGGGDSAVEAAIGLAAQGTNRVTLSYRKAEFSRIKERNAKHMDEAIRRKQVTTLFSSEVQEIREKSVLLKTSQSVVEIPNECVFIFAGGEMPFEFLRKVGIAFHSAQLQ